MSKIYKILFSIWCISLLVYLGYTGAYFYEVNKEERLVKRIGEAQTTTSGDTHEAAKDSSVFALEGAIKDSLITYATTYYLAIPESIRQRFIEDGWKVVLTDKDISKTYYSGSVKGRLAGLTNFKTKRIYIHAKRSDIRRALIHEFGHYVDYASNGISGSESFHQIYQSEKNHLNEKWKIDSHNISNPQEYFAESFSQFLVYPSKSKTDTPKTYAIMKETISVFE